VTRLNSWRRLLLVVQEPVGAQWGAAGSDTHTDRLTAAIFPFRGGRDLPGQGPPAAGSSVAVLGHPAAPTSVKLLAATPAKSGGRQGSWASNDGRLGSADEPPCLAAV
jgi:hypothetical protein